MRAGGSRPRESREGGETKKKKKEGSRGTRPEADRSTLDRQEVSSSGQRDNAARLLQRKRKKSEKLGSSDTKRRGLEGLVTTGLSRVRYLVAKAWSKETET